VKLFGGEVTRAGNIVIRQKGDVYQLGKNVYKGKDFSIHATIDGVVHFRKKNITRFDGSVYLKTFVDVLPAGDEAAKPAKAPKTAAAKASKPAAAKKTAAVKAPKVEVDGDVAEVETEKKVAPEKKAPAAKTDKKPAAKAEAKPAKKKTA